VGRLACGCMHRIAQLIYITWFTHLNIYLWYQRRGRKRRWGRGTKQKEKGVRVMEPCAGTGRRSAGHGTPIPILNICTSHVMHVEFNWDVRSVVLWLERPYARTLARWTYGLVWNKLSWQMYIRCRSPIRLSYTSRTHAALVTTRTVWFFDVLFTSKYIELMSQLKVCDIQLTKIQTSKNHRHKFGMWRLYISRHKLWY
jgi:hypothetical protein